MLTAIVLALGACEPVYVNHGFAPQRAELDNIVAGQDTRGSVMRKLGRPSTVSSFDADTWYFAASKVKKFAFYAPEVIDRKVVAVTFNADGLVTDAKSYGLEDGQIIDLVTRRTPTYGREMTVLQQVFGNLGKFDAGQAFDPLSGGGSSGDPLGGG
ncbi:outer membrane protein assembly factor BamE [Pikeienuella piscinae]|uniref:Outer membrane protein assembly factor BamE n=1 Tax=Pikeienuella piscinae TaxID=2748098 RepID=A0A7L5BTB9_9RHOB|nr:outer membrane protein assembly factor BamE [Pikeienuella piscinae]QIE55190.1 outer membrane protein assembly factor BamE [Pikeienuella piscinae]